MAQERLIRAQPVLKRFVIAVLFGTMLIRAGLIITDWNFGDINAYWLAAERIKHGRAALPGLAQPGQLPGLPLRTVVRLVLGAADLPSPAPRRDRLGGGAWPRVRLDPPRPAALRSAAGVGLALILTPWLLSLVQVGNIQPLVVAALAFGMSRRAGPAWVGVTAALKIVPGLFALVYVARREWRRALLAVVWTAVFAAPFLLYDLSGYQTDPGRSYSLYYFVSPVAWVVGATAAVVIAVLLAWRRSRYIWVAAAIAVMLAGPRTHVTYATYLVVGLLGGPADRAIRGADD